MTNLFPFILADNFWLFLQILLKAKNLSFGVSLSGLVQDHSSQPDDQFDILTYSKHWPWLFLLLGIESTHTIWCACFLVFYLFVLLLTLTMKKYICMKFCLKFKEYFWDFPKGLFELYTKSQVVPAF